MCGNFTCCHLQQNSVIFVIVGLLKSFWPRSAVPAFQSFQIPWWVVQYSGERCTTYIVQFSGAQCTVHSVHCLVQFNSVQCWVFCLVYGVPANIFSLNSPIWEVARNFQHNSSMMEVDTAILTGKLTLPSVQFTTKTPAHKSDVPVA